MSVPIIRQIICVQREIQMRERVYASRVAAGKMKQRVADEEIEAMKAVGETLRKISNDDLFSCPAPNPPK